MALTDFAIRSAKPRVKPYKMGDSGGLFLLVQPSGGKLWRFKYRIEGEGGKRVERKLSLGTYPEVGLSAARERRDSAREQLALRKDPSREKRRADRERREGAANTFSALADEYCQKRKLDGERRWSPATASRNEYLLRQLRGSIGAMPIADIEAVDVLDAVRKLEKRGKLETARRALQLASMIFRHALRTARLKSDPTRDLRGALITPKVTHYGAITDPQKVGGLLRAIDGYDGQGLTRLALQLAPLVFVRPGELRQAEWSEFDWERALWTIPAPNTKMRKEHRVPLSAQAVAILKEVQLVTGEDRYVFPSIRTPKRPMSENTLNAALRRLGYAGNEMTAHGFRAMASTLLNESGKWSPDAIERALAHGDADKVRAAYHRGAHWNERVAMAQWWSDHLDTLRTGAEVVPFPATARA